MFKIQVDYVTISIMKKTNKLDSTSSSKLLIYKSKFSHKDVDLLVTYL
jgi:hypothetical protein